MFKNLSKKMRILTISSVITAVLLIASLIGNEVARAWFRDYLDVTNPATLTNFKVVVKYSDDNGANWKDVSDNNTIPLTSVEAAKNIQVKIEYTGHSAAYVRTSVYGNFYNKHTGTVLPQPEDFWGFSIPQGHKWTYLSGGDYWYYTTRLENLQESDFVYATHNHTTTLDSLKIDVDLDKLGTISDYQDYEGKVYILVDVVQPDRCDDLWGVASSEFVASSGA